MIVGGAGGSGTSGGANGTGGPGILGQGATIINSGTISSYGGSSTGRAVLFTAGANSLTLKEGSTLTGTAGKSGGTAKLVIEVNTAAQTLDVTSIGAYSTVSTLKYQGFDTFEKIGADTLTLSGTTSVVTPWTVKGGILSISKTSSLGANSSTLTLDGGALEVTGTSIAMLGTGRPITIGSSGGTITIVDASASVTADGIVSGSAGSFTKAGAGTLRLSGTNTFTGATFVTGGTLELAGSNTYTGATTLSGGGTLLVTSGSVSGNIATDNGSTSGTVVINKSGSIIYSGVLSGSGNLIVTAGNVTLTGANTLSGNTSVSGQLTLRSGGALAGTVDVQSGGSLNGDVVGLTSGSISGAVSIHNGGALQSISGTTTLTTGTLSFASNALLVTTLDSPSTTAAVSVNGNLVLDGALAVVASGGPSASPADGAYRLFDYTGTLTDNGLTISGAPAYSLYTINTAISHQVDLIVIAGQWWNGTTTTSGGSSVQGGDGTWDVAGGATNWTNQAGATAHAWTQGGIAVFGGAAGTVTISGATAPDLVGAFFVTDGYVVTGGALTASAFAAGAVPQFSAESGTTGTIASSIAGTDGLEKVGLGTLVLSGGNTYTGGTTVSAGTLQLGDGTGVGSVVGDIVDNAALVFANPTAQTYGGVVSGSGTLTKQGAGTLTLTANNTYTGTTTISAGTLQLGNGGNTGSVAGNIVDNAALVLNTSGTGNNVLALNGAISGSGTIEKLGSGRATFNSNANSYTGATTVSEGTLEIIYAGGLGSIAAGTTVASGATLMVSASGTVAEPMTISGTGDTANAGSGVYGAVFSGSADLSGAITLADDATIYVASVSGAVTGDGKTLTVIGGQSSPARR
ncbi:hypothetical protein F0357_18030 [Rhizobiales bacterium Sp-1]|uniref:Autotransporter domain-containing protein n=2 Tax=Segnochrobactrum spirostomi TaxID=2608987 RepID=A0A6A7Y730_9HYPH|nr:hypothetical protein [Segnochrobactrum spirostomi]